MYKRYKEIGDKIISETKENFHNIIDNIKDTAIRFDTERSGERLEKLELEFVYEDPDATKNSVDHTYEYQLTISFDDKANPEVTITNATSNEFTDYDFSLLTEPKKQFNKFLKLDQAIKTINSSLKKAIDYTEQNKTRSQKDFKSLSNDLQNKLNEVFSQFEKKNNIKVEREYFESGNEHEHLSTNWSFKHPLHIDLRLHFEFFWNVFGEGSIACSNSDSDTRYGVLNFDNYIPNGKQQPDFQSLSEVTNSVECGLNKLVEELTKINNKRKNQTR